MMPRHRTVLHTAQLDAQQRQLLIECAGGQFEQRNGFYLWVTSQPIERDSAEQLRATLPFDLNPLPAHFQSANVRLLASDMDSTFITVECIDEIARIAGCNTEVAAITAAATRGEIDFAESLRRRVAALRGTPMAVLQRVYDERVQLTAGAAALLRYLAQRGVEFALITGGFTFFTDQLSAHFAIQHTAANRLLIDAQQRLTGTVTEPILDARGKANVLQALRHQLGITEQQTIAVGDGANDLLMLAQAGLGVAFRAKPKVRAQADAVLQLCGLDALAHFFEADA